MDNSIGILISRDESKAAEALKEFLQKSSTVFTFPELNEHSYRSDLWDALYSLTSSEHTDVHRDCLAAIRILSRDKTNLNELATKEWLDLLLHHACLKDDDKNLNEGNNYVVGIEALKCLCNIIFNSTVARAICCKNGTLEGIVKRIKTYKEKKVLLEVKYFDMKILFLITALCSEIRGKMKDELHGLTYLIETLDLILKELHENDHNSDITGMNNCKLSDEQIDLCCEILKALFNLSVHSYDTTVDEEEETHFVRLVTVLHDLLLADAQSATRKQELDNHVINLLTNMPDQCLKQLVTVVTVNQVVVPKMVYEGQNMSALYEILRFLRNRFGSDPTVSNQHEALSPVLSVLLKCATSDRSMRKYLRQQILPPLTDVHHRPEEGNTLRNHLCRLLTTPITQVRDLSSEFLFVLCKENVDRMIKYTGYGNAAGMFAKRGLLGGRNGHTSNYSSDSDDSETEEYFKHKEGINPVMGCYQAPRPNPTAHMTEEQKEYEAMKLVELMDNLTKKGIVKPCRIGEDGRPEPIEHVLQLQEGIGPQLRGARDEDDSD